MIIMNSSISILYIDVGPHLDKMFLHSACVLRSSDHWSAIECIDLISLRQELIELGIAHMVAVSIALAVKFQSDTI